VKKPKKKDKVRPIRDADLANVHGGAGSGATLGPHPNPPIGPGG
jgi:hypothetical protein